MNVVQLDKPIESLPTLLWWGWGGVCVVRYVTQPIKTQSRRRRLTWRPRQMWLTGWGSAWHGRRVARDWDWLMREVGCSVTSADCTGCLVQSFLCVTWPDSVSHQPCTRTSRRHLRKDRIGFLITRSGKALAPRSRGPVLNPVKVY